MVVPAPLTGSPARIMYLRVPRVARNSSPVSGAFSSSFPSLSLSSMARGEERRRTRSRQRWQQRRAIGSTAGTRPVPVRTAARRRACAAAQGKRGGEKSQLGRVSSRRCATADFPKEGGGVWSGSEGELTGSPRWTTGTSVVRPHGRASAAGVPSEMAAAVMVVVMMPPVLQGWSQSSEEPSASSPSLFFLLCFVWTAVVSERGGRGRGGGGKGTQGVEPVE